MDVNVQKARELDVSVLDVRTPPEFAQGHLKGAVNIDIYDPEFDKKISQLENPGPWLVYCRTASRSRLAAQLMEELGFEVFHMLGGIMEWQARGYPVEQQSL